MEAFSLLVIEVGETSSLWMVTSWGWWSLGAVRKQDEQASRVVLRDFCISSCLRVPALLEFLI